MPPRSRPSLFPFTTTSSTTNSPVQRRFSDRDIHALSRLTPQEIGEEAARIRREHDELREMEEDNERAAHERAERASSRLEEALGTLRSPQPSPAPLSYEWITSNDPLVPPSTLGLDRSASIEEQGRIRARLHARRYSQTPAPPTRPSAVNMEFAFNGQKVALELFVYNEDRLVLTVSTRRGTYKKKLISLINQYPRGKLSFYREVLRIRDTDHGLQLCLRHTDQTRNTDDDEHNNIVIAEQKE